MAHQTLKRCDLASGILVRHGDPEAAEASEPLAAELDRLQLELDQGPGVQACETSATVTSDDFLTETRWPSFSPQARRHGIAAVVSVPLTPERDLPGWYGWLTIYSRQPGPFSSASIAQAQTLGRYCSNAVNSALHARNFAAALASRDLVEQAKGIIMARKNVDDQEAFAILQQTSHDTHRPLRDIAETVVRSHGHQGIDEQTNRQR